MDLSPDASLGSSAAAAAGADPEPVRPRSALRRHRGFVGLGAITAVLTMAPWLTRPRGRSVDLDGGGRFGISVALVVCTLALVALLAATAFYAGLPAGRTRRLAQILVVVSTSAAAAQLFATWYWLETPQWDIVGAWLLITAGSIAVGALLTMPILGLDAIARRRRQRAAGD